MTQEQITTLAQTACLPGGGPVELIETHISWVLLTPSYAFKFKKPLQFSFLDYSTLELREQYCREELRLNRRLAPDMYLDVLPVGYRDARLCIDADLDPARAPGSDKRRGVRRAEAPTLAARGRETEPA